MKVEIRVTRNGEDDQEFDVLVMVPVDEGVVSRVAYDEDGMHWELTDEERDKARGVWERLEQ